MTGSIENLVIEAVHIYRGCIMIIYFYRGELKPYICDVVVPDRGTLVAVSINSACRCACVHAKRLIDGVVEGKLS
jgi:hypothetical protein